MRRTSSRINLPQSACLIYASQWGQSETVKPLLEKGADANAKDKYGRSALMIGEEYVVVLPEKMKQALQKYDSTFTPWRQSDFMPSIVKIYKFSSNQTPFAVIGDFNGDKIKDVALEGHNKNTDLLICILSSGKGYKVVEVWREGGLTDPKKVNYFEKASSLYYFKGNKFLGYATEE